MHEIAFYYKVNSIEDFDTKDFNLIEDDQGHIIKLDFKWIDINQIDKYNIKTSYLKEIIKNNLKFKHLVINDLNIDQMKTTY